VQTDKHAHIIIITASTSITTATAWMPSYGSHHDASRPYERAVRAPPKTTHRSRHTTRRIGEQDGRPFVEVVETTEEVIRTRPQVSPLHRGASRGRTRTQPHHESEAEADDYDNEDYPRLEYNGNDRASRRNLSSPAGAVGRVSGHDTPRSAAAGGSNSARNRSITNRGQTPRGYIHTPLNSQPTSTSSRRRNGSGQRRERVTGLVESPADITTLDDYDTPTRHRRGEGRYIYDYGNGYDADAKPHNGHHRDSIAVTGMTGGNNGSGNVCDPRANPRPRPGSPLDSSAVAAEAETQTSPFHFRVRIHECRNLFDDLRDAHRAAPAVYFAIHTAEKRGHTGVTAGGDAYDPIFNDEFIFTSVDPERDALVCTLVATAPSSQRRDKKVAECVLALHKLAWQVERKVWVPLVRHPGTKQAYEQGEVRVSIYSEDYGYDEVASEAEETACSTAIHNSLLRYAPEELHRLDWLTAAYVDKGPAGWEQLQASYRARTIEPAPVKVTLLRVDGLMDDAGRPVGACDVYVVVDDGHTERQSKSVPYRNRATFNQDFHLTLINPESDTMCVTVFGNGRKLGEAVAGLTNVKAGVSKEVTLMLVRAAETGDASNGGQVVLTLQTQKYSSPYQMSAAQEAKLRLRVRNYLWCYLRDDLHRLDAIVGSIDNEDMYMREWARTIGPERTPKLLSISVREATHIGAENNGMAPRCYARVCVGPETLRTELVISRNGSAAFKTPLHVHVYDPARDAVELTLIADGDDGEKEISRVTFGVCNLPQGRRVVRSLHLVADALKRTAHVQGEVVVELMAEDFGKIGAEADAAVAKMCSPISPNVQRLEAITQRSSPEKLHRVPLILDTADPDEANRVVEEEARQHATDVAVAPMTVKILGVRGFKQATDFYVKVYLNNESILRTGDVKGGTDVTLNIDDNNERTLRLGNAAQSLMTFKIARHRALLKSVVLGVAEVALSTLIRGEKNTLWLPFFRSSNDDAGPAKKSSASCTSGKPEKSVKVKGNRMPQANGGGSSRSAQQQQNGELGDDVVAAAVARHGGASPVGFLGVELQSMAFPNTTVTEYIIKDESGAKSVPAQTVVTADVTSLVAKMRPSDLPKVQPMIAQCSSLKDAHAELRAQLSPVPIAGTVYVQIQSVELTMPEGQMQERAGGVAVEATFGSEREVSHKRIDVAGSAGAGGGRSRARYSRIRLDIPESAVTRGGGGSARGGKGAKGGNSTEVPALELRLIGGAPRGRVASGVGGAAGEGVAHPAAGNESGFTYDDFDGASDATADSHYVGGENNINSYLKSPKRHRYHWGIKQPDEERTGRPSKMLIAQQQQHEQMQNHSTSVSPARSGDAVAGPSVPKRPWRANSAFNNASYYHNPQQQPGYNPQRSKGTEEESDKYYLGGVNNIRSYAVSPTRSNSRHQSPSRQDYRNQSDFNNNSRMTSPAPGTLAGATYTAPYHGEIGLVRLSLRALLTSPLYKLGDTLRVPIVVPTMPASLSYRDRHSPDVNQRCVVGHITLRIALPAFEHVAESLRLGSRHLMSNVVPDYIHYYERRIGAYLRTNNAPDLVSFHYILYERDIASGSWPVSLYDWMQSLIKRYGPETANFGPEPPLPFDPEEWERARLQDEALRSEREAAFASERSGASEEEDSEEDLYSPKASPKAEGSSRRADTSVRRHSKDSSKAPADATYSF
jgi:hypothetical protein